MELTDLMSIAKTLNLSADQKDIIKKVLKEAAGNKTKIAAELKKHGINVTAEQIDMIMKVADKL